MTNPPVTEEAVEREIKRQVELFNDVGLRVTEAAKDFARQVALSFPAPVEELVADIRMRMATANIDGRPVLHVFDECAAAAIAALKSPPVVSEELDEQLMLLIEPITKAIVFEDCGNTANWQDNTNLGIAVVRAIRPHILTMSVKSEATQGEVG